MAKRKAKAAAAAAPTPTPVPSDRWRVDIDLVNDQDFGYTLDKDAAFSFVGTIFRQGYVLQDMASDKKNVYDARYYPVSQIRRVSIRKMGA